MQTIESKNQQNEKEFKRLCRNIYKHYYSSEGNFPKVTIKSNQTVIVSSARPVTVKYNEKENEIIAILNPKCFYPNVSNASLNLAAFEIVACIRCLVVGKKFTSGSGSCYRTVFFENILKDLKISYTGKGASLKITDFSQTNATIKNCSLASKYNFVKYESNEIFYNYFKEKKDISYKKQLIPVNGSVNQSENNFKFKFICPKCGQSAKSDDKIDLVCGKCFIRMNTEVL